MSVNGIGYYGNSYGVHNISSLYRRQMQSAVKKVNRISNMGNSRLNRYLEKSSSHFLRSYNQSMSDLMSSANALKTTNRTGIWNKATAQSSNTKVLDVKQNYTMGSLGTNDSYKVNVKQLATAQKNVSAGVEKDALATADTALSVETSKGNFTFRVSAKDTNGNQKTNGQMMREMADTINQSGIGVNASINTKDGKSQFTLVAKETGKKNAFTVSGDYADKNGLAKPVEEAKDAEYTVSKNDQEEKTFTSDSNKVSLDYGRLTADLHQTGESTVKIGVHEDKVVSAVKDLVGSYNDTLKMLAKNTDRGSGVERQLARMLQMPISEKSLELVGISQDKNGLLQLDENKLRENIGKNPALTKEVLGGSFSMAQTMFENGRQGLSQSGASLIENDIGIAQNNYENNMFTIMGTFGRTSPFAMSNMYTVGSLLNLLA